MEAKPSVVACVLLAILWACLLATIEWSRRRPDRSTETRLDRPSVVPRWALPAAFVVALLPAAAVTILSHAPWQATVWWCLLSIPAAVVIVVVLGSGAGLVWVWVRNGGYVEPEGRAATWTCMVLIVAAVLVLTTLDAVLIASGVALANAVSASLLLSYLLWQAAYAVLRRAHLA
jgi:hypothetical protein